MPTCGIYQIYCPNSGLYIGQSKNIENRIAAYRRGDCKSQGKLYNSIKKYGWGCHTVSIIIVCNQDRLDYLEKYFISYSNTYKTPVGLNLTKGGRSAYILSDESRKKMVRELNGCKNPFFGKKHSTETKKLWSEKRKGVRPSQETINKMKERNNGRKTPVSTEEIKEATKRLKELWGNDVFRHKMSTGRIGGGNPAAKMVYQYDINDNFIKAWDSGATADRYFSPNIYRRRISKCCTNEIKSAYGYKWKYK